MRPRRFFLFLLLGVLLFLVGQTDTTGIGIDQVISLISYMFPVLVLLAVLSMLFGFLRNIDKAWGK